MRIPQESVKKFNKIIGYLDRCNSWKNGGESESSDLTFNDPYLIVIIIQKES